MSKIIDHLVIKNSKNQVAVIFQINGLTGKATEKEIKNAVAGCGASKVRVYYWYDDAPGSLHERNVVSKFSLEFEKNGLTNGNSGCFTIDNYSIDWFHNIYEPNTFNAFELRNDTKLEWIKPRQGCDGGVLSFD